MRLDSADRSTATARSRCQRDRHRREPHEGPVGRRLLVDMGIDRLAGLPEPLELPAHGHPDVEAAPVRRQVVVIAPEEVPAQVVGEVEPAAVDDRLGEAQRHRRVVGPLAGGQAERTAAHHVGDRLERAGGAELDGRPDRIPAGQADQRPSRPVPLVRHHHSATLMGPSMASSSGAGRRVSDADGLPVHARHRARRCAGQPAHRRRPGRRPAAAPARPRARPVGAGRPRPRRPGGHAGRPRARAAASGCARPSATGASSAPAARRRRPAIIDAGAAFELLQAFAVIHDDVMDGSSSRRGARTAHLRLRRPPRRRGVAGRAAALRRGRGHPHRQPGPRARRPARRRRRRGSAGRVARAAARAEHGPVPRHGRHRPARHPDRPGPPRGPLQVRQVHGRASAARRAPHWPGGCRSCRPALRVRRSGRRGVPAPRRPARRVRRRGADGQADRRGPPGGQADAAAGRDGRPLLRGRRPDAARPGRVARPERWPRWTRSATSWTRSGPGPRSRPPSSGSSARAVALARGHRAHARGAGRARRARRRSSPPAPTELATSRSVRARRSARARSARLPRARPSPRRPPRATAAGPRPRP